MNKKLRNTIWVVLMLLLAVLFLFVINALMQSEGWGNFALDKFVNLPNYLVFVATGISACLLFITLNDQKRANQIAAFENRFFKFIDYHRDNVNQMKYRNPDATGDIEFWEGNQVFTVIHYQVRNLLREFFKDSDWKNPFIEQKREAVAFVYDCIFFGAGDDGLRILKKSYEKSPEYFKWVNFENRPIAEAKKDHESKSNENKEYPGNSVDRKYYSGHVRRLGHYFRNIYQAIKYVDEQKFLTENEKYNYVKTFRAQMSVYEQVVFFYNSLSKLGESWEWEEFTKKYPKDLSERNKSFKNLLITKYDLIRNTLYTDVDGKIIDEISMKEFFPLINLEHEEECSIFGALPFVENETIICRFCFNEKYIGYDNGDIEEKIRDYYNRRNFTQEGLVDKLGAFRCDEKCRSKPFIEKIKLENQK